MAGLTGFVPVFTGIYSDPEHLKNSMMNSAMTCDLGGFQLLDLIIMELKSHMTC